MIELYLSSCPVIIIHCKNYYNYIKFPYDIFQNKRILLLIQSCNSDGNNSNKCIENINNKELNLINENVLTRLGSFF
jgi:Fe-S-cluster-containing hydrogenase component 2